MRISESCVNSEDIKTKCGAESIVALISMGYGLFIIDNKHNCIGTIKEHKMINLGDDLIINKINIFNNKELSDELTKLYRDKILILNYSKDYYN